MRERHVSYDHSGVVLEGYLAAGESTGAPRPGVLIAHAWGGRGAVEEATARRLADLGYVGFALDLFGQGVRGHSREENAALIQPFLEDRGFLQNRMIKAVDVLREQSEVDSTRIAALGYCFGGLCVLDLARSGSDIAGVVSIHGLFAPPDPHPGRPISAKVLALHGHEDPMVPVAAVNGLEVELTEAGADWQIHVYGGTMHAFTNPEANDPDFGTVYSPVAAQRAWNSVVAFLQEVLAQAG
jgi:dienelactone hydrolase